ncbi:hypothetical protein SAMN04244559_01386 [Magnetospirillum fulvum]|uniref:Uncharacterized protein n=2 Tax=Magnetospirillum fulvum TaxID=1082 RepID=A0A1H6HHA9_MAGFU|nr:hypothetical protein SAMN04244559_01386 [Magnetospirillum fulvum]
MDSGRAAMDRNAEQVWLKPSGAPVSCVEKIKVLNENYAELKALAHDALEDALILGCSTEQFRQILHDMIDGLTSSIAESDE